jgi:hypothetical protein
MSFQRGPASKNLLKHPNLNKRVDGLKGMAWAYAACHFQEQGASYMGTIYKDQKPAQVNTPKNSIYINGKLKREIKITSSNVFYQYLKGKRAPIEGKRGKNNYDLVGDVHSNQKSGLAEKWFYHPFWKIFCENPSEIDLLNLINDAPVEYEDHFTIPLNDHLLNQLKLDSFDTFIAICAAYRLGLMTNNVPLIYSSYELITHLTPQASTMDVAFNYIHKPFLKMILDFLPPKIDDSRISTTGKIIYLHSEQEPQFTEAELEEMERLGKL